MIYSVVFDKETDITLEKAARISGIPLSSIDLNYGLQVIDFDKKEYVFLVFEEQNLNNKIGYSDPEIGPWQRSSKNCN